MRVCLIKEEGGSIYLRGGGIQTRNGENTIFRMGDKPICLTSHVLYDLCVDKNITVFEFLRKNGCIRFGRWLPPVLFNSWLDLVNKVFTFHFETLGIKLSGSGIKMENSPLNQSMNTFLMGALEVVPNTSGKCRLPYKIKIFTWLAKNKVVLTKDNMVRKKWPGDPSCCFCSQKETMDHLAKVTWGVGVLWHTVLGN